jgi:Kef-type K+ transport system membrane component KefB
VLALDNLFYEFGLILGIAAFVGLLGTALRQPLIVAFIAVGIAVGPAWLDLTGDAEELELLAEVGIALLLFVVGLKLDLQVIRVMGRVALITGLGQVIFTSVVGFGIAVALGFSTVHAAYIAIALTFSSTIIIVKLLSDKREIDSLHGRIAIGFLIVQDIVVVLAMIGISAFAIESDASPAQDFLWVLVKGAGMLAAVAFLMRYLIPWVLPVFARSQELLILSAIAWAVGLAITGDVLGFSKEVGAFLAGVSLASTPYREAISGRLTSVRDFLLLFFFVTLGASLELDTIGAQVVPAIILSLFVLIGNPLIVILIMGIMGYRKRTGFLAGLAVAQISEFSLIFAALGMNIGHIDADTLGLITLVGLITIGASTYMIMYSHPLYDRIGRLLTPFERDMEHPEDRDDVFVRNCDVILFGLGRYGGGMADALRERNVRVLGVDFDPQVVRQWRQRGLPVHYGDAEDPELLHHLPLSQATWVVSSAPGLETNFSLLRALRLEGYRGRVAVTAHSQGEADVLESAGADLVLRPFADAAVQAVDELMAVGSRSAPAR